MNTLIISFLVKIIIPQKKEIFLSLFINESKILIIIQGTVAPIFTPIFSIGGCPQRCLAVLANYILDL